MITDPDLAAAVGDRAHWRPEGSGAVYPPPESSVTVLARRMAQPTGREEFIVSVIRDGRALYTTPCYTAAEAVRMAERVRG